MFAPHKDPPLGTLGGERVQGGDMGSTIKEFWARVFFRATDGDRRAPDDMRDGGGGIIEVADKNSLSRANDDAGRLKADI